MNINTEAIAELRKGLTGNELAEHEIRGIARGIARYIASSTYASDTLVGRFAFEAGMLQGALRRVCNLLAEAVDDPEPNPDMGDVHAAEAAQDWQVTDALDRAAIDRMTGKEIAA